MYIFQIAPLSVRPDKGEPFDWQFFELPLRVNSGSYPGGVEARPVPRGVPEAATLFLTEQLVVKGGTEKSRRNEGAQAPAKRKQPVKGGVNSG